MTPWLCLLHGLGTVRFLEGKDFQDLAGIVALGVSFGTLIGSAMALMYRALEIDEDADFAEYGVTGGLILGLIALGALVAGLLL